MSQAMDFESDQKLRLLTEALRAGPGTPEWRTAIEELKLQNGQAVEDEYRILLRIREDLASGRSYREVRAGPGFTRQVMEGLKQEEPGKDSSAPGPGWIAAVAALLIIGVVAIVAGMLWPREPAVQAGPDLGKLYFVNTAVSTSFEADLEPPWRRFGNLQLLSRNGLTPIGTSSEAFRGGGVYWEQAIAAEQAFAAEATISLSRSNPDAAVQLFVTDEPTFEGRSATSGRELVCGVKGNQVNALLPDGRVEGKTLELKGGAQELELRVVVNRRDAVVECNGQQLWSGAHQLEAGKARYVGVRLLLRRDSQKDRPVVESVKVMKP